MATEGRGAEEKSGGERPDLALYGELGANIVGFCRLLRRAGVGVGPSEAAAALQAVTKMGAADAVGFRLALLLTLAKSPGERRIFARHFAAYWMVWDRATQLNRGKARRQEVERRREEPPRAALVTISDWLKSAAAVEDEREAAGYSPYEVLSRRDFSRLGPDEDEERHHIAQSVAQATRRGLWPTAQPRAATSAGSRNFPISTTSSKAHGTGTKTPPTAPSQERSDP